ncbi:hypothetical protein CR513_50346, partial [Mucuna pruriens]
MALCSPKCVTLLLLLSAIPIGIIVTLERHPRLSLSHFWVVLRRCQVRFSSSPLEEVTVVRETHLAGNASLGIAIDPHRNRVLVVNADMFGNRCGELAAYDLSTWHRLLLTQFSGPSKILISKLRYAAGDIIVTIMSIFHWMHAGDEKTFDAEGNAYVTDAKGNKIWKVGWKGSFYQSLQTHCLPLRSVYHPDGFLIVIHTLSGNLFKIDLTKKEEVEVKITNVKGGTLSFGDGLELLSPSKLIVAGNIPSRRLVESSDGWNTAYVVRTLSGPKHRFATAAVKDGKVYLNYMIGIGYPKKKHAIVEAVF